jgi:hypothetical protein
MRGFFPFDFAQGQNDMRVSSDVWQGGRAGFSVLKSSVARGLWFAASSRKAVWLQQTACQITDLEETHVRPFKMGNHQA